MVQGLTVYHPNEAIHLIWDSTNHLTTQFKAFFGEDEDPLESECSAEMWLTANEEDPEAI